MSLISWRNKSLKSRPCLSGTRSFCPALRYYPINSARIHSRPPHVPYFPFFFKKALSSWSAPKNKPRNSLYAACIKSGATPRDQNNDRPLRCRLSRVPFRTEEKTLPFPAADIHPQVPTPLKNEKEEKCKRIQARNISIYDSEQNTKPNACIKSTPTRCAYTKKKVRRRVTSSAGKRTRRKIKCTVVLFSSLYLSPILAAFPRFKHLPSPFDP